MKAVTTYSSGTFMVAVLVFLLFHSISSAQEWSNLREYEKATGMDSLSEGHWLTKDRLGNSSRWIRANHYHIDRVDGMVSYSTISQRRDFYKWFDRWREEQGHEIVWAGAAYTVSVLLAYADRPFVKTAIIHDKELVGFVNRGSRAIFNDSFKALQKIYRSKHLLTGESARKWDSAYLYREQFEVVDSVYQQCDSKTQKHIKKMMWGKGRYGLGVPKELRFRGDVLKASDRHTHGIKKVYPYYKLNYAGKEK